jgi:protein SCO1
MAVKRAMLLMAALLLCAGQSWAARSYAARGLVLKVDKAHSSLLISCEKIPDFMDAMVMPFSVHDPQEMEELTAGTMIEFTLVVNETTPYIEKIRIHKYEGVEQDPLSARRLKLMTSIADTAAAPQRIKIGETAPDFSLIDQNLQNVTLSQFKGKVVAITFTYTHCALPNFCFRIANNFRLLQKRFAGQLGSDLVFITITFDPAHDTPEVMAKYGKTWNADPKAWRLLSGPPSDVEAVCNRYGISFWPDEGLMTHSLHTILIDRQGNYAADLEGNEYSADELGDLVQTMLGPTVAASSHKALHE